MTFFPDILAPPDHDSDTLPDGLRLSTDCPVARIREFIDPENATPFDEGVGVRGHEIARLVGEWWLSTDARAEVVIPWRHGTSHIDFIDPAIGTAGACLEIKSTKDAKHPSEENFRQVQRMIWASQEAEMRLPELWLILLVDLNFHKVGEYRVTLTPERAAEIESEMAATEKLLDRADAVDLDAIDTFESVGLACRCGQCCRVVTEEPALREHLETLYLLQEQDVSAEIKAVREEIRAMLEPGAKVEQDVLIGGMAPAAASVSMSKPREPVQRVVKWSQALQAGAIPGELLDELAARGFVESREATPRLTVRIKEHQTTGSTI